MPARPRHRARDVARERAPSPRLDRPAERPVEVTVADAQVNLLPMPSPHFHTTTAALRALWPGVSPYELQEVLHAWWEQEPGVVDGLIAEVLALSGPAAASRLTAPLLARLQSTAARQRSTIYGALEIVVRAGGDATPGFAAAAAAVGDRYTASAAGRFLRVAALAGGSLVPVLDALEAAGAGTHEREVLRALSLGRLQRAGEADAIRTLAQVHDAHPVANFVEAIGLMEAQLLAQAPAAEAEARAALAGLGSAGADLFRAWQHLTPLLVRTMAEGDEDQRTEAVRSLGQVRYTPPYASDETRARAELPGLLEPLMLPLAAALADPGAVVASAAATTLDLFVELGASAHAVRAALAAALHHDLVVVRQHASHCLSSWLRAAGEEAKLPSGHSHRRRYAASDAPLEGGRRDTCGLCGAPEVRTIWKAEDVSQTHAHITVETLCGACGIYGEQHGGYG
jgi:hypothetical protein